MILEVLDEQDKFNFVQQWFRDTSHKIQKCSEDDEIVGNAINILIYTLCSFCSKQRLYWFRKHINFIRIDSIFPNSKNFLKLRKKG